ncbi:thioredoxin family protein [Vaginella massiliensis]|uniref:thioredoxin family protein n=1 Tax=Vaginella massiliensis TaxID=1816680 RepID=UPI000839A945|nr:thioredoxin family protein [Vaginella massiliensis]
MKTIILFISLIFSSAVFAQGVQWKSLEEAEALIKKDPTKQILLYFYTDWCGYCKKMEKETFAQSEAADFINQHYIPVKFNAESKDNVHFLGYNYSYIPKGRVNAFAFFLLQGQAAYPSTIIINKDTKASQFLMGYLSPSNFMAQLNNPN